MNKPEIPSLIGVMDIPALLKHLENITPQQIIMQRKYSPQYDGGYSFSITEGGNGKAGYGIAVTKTMSCYEEFKKYIDSPYWDQLIISEIPFKDISYKQWLYGVIAQGVAANPKLTHTGATYHEVSPNEIGKQVRRYIEAIIDIQTTK